MPIDKTQPLDGVIDELDEETVDLKRRVGILEGVIEAPAPPSIDTVLNGSTLLGKNVVGFGLAARMLDLNDTRQGRAIASLDSRFATLEKN